MGGAGDAKGANVNICHSIERSALARTAIASLGESITPKDLWLLLSTAPCRAEDTVYTSAMCPRSGELLTRAWVLRQHERAGQRRWGKMAKQALAGSLNECVRNPPSAR